MRLAWFSPWPPQSTAAAGRSAAAVPCLAARGHAIDVVVDGAAVAVERHGDGPVAPGQHRLISAHDFVWRQARGQYDLSIYHLANAPSHRFIWPYAFRYPGLTVLTEARLHFARVEALLSRRRAQDYCDEFAWNHPDAAAASGLSLLGLDGVQFSLWPMRRAAVTTARLVAAQSRFAADELRREWPDRPVEYIAGGEEPDCRDLHEASRRFRQDHGIESGAMVFGMCGPLLAQTEALRLLRAFAAVRATVPGVRLLLVGAVEQGDPVGARAHALGLTDVVHRVESRDDAEFDGSLAACDVVIDLGWPGALGTSGPWVRSLALSRPTIILDAPEHSHVPALDPRTWRRHAPCDDLHPDADDRAVTIALDLADLDHSLRLAMRRLAQDDDLRARLGRAAREYWEREYTVARMVDDYERAVALAVTCASPPFDGPAHLRPDPASHLRQILSGTGIASEAVATRVSIF